MIIELHSLTSHAPANLNRDDLGRPKSAVFGGANRARISSQAIKRSIRTSNYLGENLDDKLSTRSRKIPQLIYNDLTKETGDNAALNERISELCKGFSNVLGKADKKDPMMTSQIVFLTPGEIKRAKEHIMTVAKGDEKLTAAFIKKFAEGAAAEIGLNRNPGDGVDMALFGRMTTDDANAFASVDASMQVAHAISTHAVVPETDWFTAVDDFTSGEEERGSGHIGELEFNSAVFYKYFSCNLPLLVRNMNGATGEAVEALATVLDAACRTTPSGKQNTFASHSLADTVLLIRRDQRIPVSLANAFERPVSGDTGFLATSRDELVKHYKNLHTAYNLNDNAAFFCLDPKAREELQGQLPEGTTVVSSLNDLFDWLKKGLSAENNA